MADVLVDTSVWIDFFRKAHSPEGDLMDLLLAEDRVVICGIVEMEILQGLKGKERVPTESLLELLPYLATERADFRVAGLLWQQLRRRGMTIPSTDCLIASLCLRHRVSLLSLDAHFDGIESLKRIRP
jgi:predicted nucleic acid-binding protein